MTTTELPDAPAPPSGPHRVLRIPDLRKATRKDWSQLVRFCAVGASGFVVNLIVFSLAFELAGMHHTAAAVVAFCVAWVNNFILNRQWTFTAVHGSPLRQGVRYLATSVLSLVLNLGILEVLVRAGAPEIPAQAVAIVAVTPVGFLLGRRWAFR
ncbi:MAG: GtrA family protein [Thermoleophilia bacterium]|nr:GtrA family protein [Thermoleophilia bacterium]